MGSLFELGHNNIPGAMCSRRCGFRAGSQRVWTRIAGGKISATAAAAAAPATAESTAAVSAAATVIAAAAAAVAVASAVAAAASAITAAAVSAIAAAFTAAEEHRGRVASARATALAGEHSQRPAI